MSRPNRLRALADLVGLDAWKGALDSEGRFNLHVDVAFGMARVGGEPEERARFRLVLKRAEIVVVVPATEPATIDQASISRESAQVLVSSRETRSSNRSIGADVSGEIGIGLGGAKAKASAKTKASAASARKASTTIMRKGSGLIVGQSKTVEGDYRWVVSPALPDGVLDGHPWDAKKKPRMKIRDDRRDRDRHIEPTVRIQVRCLREDLEIKDIVLKDATRWGQLIKSPTHRNRMVAAEAVIRDRLARAGLFHGPLDEPFAEICLIEVSVGDGG